MYRCLNNRKGRNPLPFVYLLSRFSRIHISMNLCMEHRLRPFQLARGLEQTQYRVHNVAKRPLLSNRKNLPPVTYLDTEAGLSDFSEYLTVLNN